MEDKLTQENSDVQLVSDAQPRSLIKQGLYRHYKGNLYLVQGVAVHSETYERLVVYRPLYGSFRLTVRPESMFLEEVDMPEYNYRGPRFQFLREMF